MKEEYLWHKTGSDPEIEKLENALKAFRYQETAPPALPAKIIPFERKTSRGFFRLAFTFTAFATVLVICFGVWFQFSGKKSDVAAISPEIIQPQIDEISAIEKSAEKSNDSVDKSVRTPKRFTEQKAVKIETPKQSIQRKIVKVKQNVPTVENQKNLSARSGKIEKLDNLVAENIEVKKPAVKLTKEEKYAYDQLMLALSITSSKLKLVTDKIENVEEKNVVQENER